MSFTGRIQIDASSHCQLACPSCPTASGATKTGLGAGHLRLENFVALLEGNPGLAEVELSNYGEMFLNPRLTDILRCAFERNVVLHADNGVNLNFAPDEVLEGLVRYRFRSLTCSIDGASSETYRQYRVKGDFDRVIANIRRINHYKRLYRSGFPRLKWQFIVFGHNEHEIETARKLAAELGMAFAPKLSWDDGVSPVRNRDLVQIAMRTPVLSRAEYYKATGRDYMRGICYQLWNAPVLNWDGRLTGCCRNFWGDFGVNAFETGLEESLAGEKLAYARRMLMGKAGAREDIPCSTCELYTTLQNDEQWLTEKEVAPPETGILIGVMVDPGGSEATHVDIFAAPGHDVNRILLVQPPPAVRLEIGRGGGIFLNGAFLNLPRPGDYTLYALPVRLDPSFRRKFPPMDPITMPLAVPERPVVQEFRVTM